MAHVLVRAHDDEAALAAVNATQVKNIVAVPAIGAKHFLVVAQAQAAHLRAQQRGHGGVVQCTKALLEHGAGIDHRVPVLARRRVAAQWRGGVVFQPITQGCDRAIGQAAVRGRGKDKQTKARVGLNAMADLHGLGIGQANHRCGVQACQSPNPWPTPGA